MGKSKTTSRARTRKFVIKNPVYPFEVGVWVGRQSVGGIEAYAKKVGLLEANCSLQNPREMKIGGGCWELTQGAFIWLPSVDSRIDSLGAVLHEAIHATLFIGQQIGFSACNESCEFYTYFSQYLFQQILERSIK